MPVEGKKEADMSARDAWTDALVSRFSLNQLQFMYAKERSIIGKHGGMQMAKGRKVKVWYVGHNRPTHYTVREVIGDRYKGGLNDGQPSGTEKGNWTLSEGGKLSATVLDVSQDEWEFD